MQYRSGLPLSVQFEQAENASTNDSTNPSTGDVIAERIGRRDLMKGLLAVSAMTVTVPPVALVATEQASAQIPSAAVSTQRHLSISRR
jgi:uncharacterized protein